MTYRVTCPVCGFHAEIEDLDAVLERQENHRAEYGDHHLLDFELIEHPWNSNP